MTVLSLLSTQVQNATSRTQHKALSELDGAQNGDGYSTISTGQDAEWLSYLGDMELLPGFEQMGFDVSDSSWLIKSTADMIF
jgi:hypothetical protein